MADINRIVVSRGLETARALGHYVLATFFGGDLDVFSVRSKQHVTFRALAGRGDLRVAYNTLWYSVAVVEQLKTLPTLRDGRSSS